MLPFILPKSFYQGEDPVIIAQALIGKVLVTTIDGLRTSGIITESEAYFAPTDRASHAFNYRRTPRNEMMYADAGTAYVYICYGIHRLFNIVTAGVNVPHAILIRAVEPLENPEMQMHRRNTIKLNPSLTSGPGSLSLALGITMDDNACILYQPKSKIIIEDHHINIDPQDIIATPRIGVESSRESALLAYRFVWKQSKFISAMSFTKNFF